jgi:tRNA-dihydrouridine synthase B
MPPFNLPHPFVIAPMCDFLRFGRFLEKVGAPDIFHMEYIRVHGSTDFNEHWVGFINDLGPRHKVVAQLLGNDVDALVIAAKRLNDLPVSGIDLNLGCPAPKIYKGNVGGGLLRDLALTERIIAALREAVDPKKTFSVKFRLGFEALDAWEPMMELLRKHRVDWATLHLRTVKEGYFGAVHFDLAKAAVAACPCPLVLNGDIQTVAQARELMAESGGWGVSIGRGALRYPWIFRKSREPNFTPTYADAWEYYEWVLEACGRQGPAKGYLNFLGLSVEPTGHFLKKMRGTENMADLEAVGREWILPHGDEPFPEAPFPKLYARPSMEKPNAKKTRGWREFKGDRNTTCGEA